LEVAKKSLKTDYENIVHVYLSAHWNKERKKKNSHESITKGNLVVAKDEKRNKSLQISCSL
jgi:hypothetical protein